jgi:hypothetical protein
LLSLVEHFFISATVAATYHETHNDICLIAERTMCGCCVPRQQRNAIKCRTTRRDLRERWPSWLVATAAEGRLKRNPHTYMVHAHQGYEHYPRERVREATAVYFEWLAQKETRDYDQRQQLLEMARFYRSLAGIIPASHCSGGRGVALDFRN